MKKEMLIKMKLDGEILEGKEKPSSEIRMHLRVYQEDPQVMAVVHAHPKFATLFAIANRPIDSRILPEGIVQLAVHADDDGVIVGLVSEIDPVGFVVPVDPVQGLPQPHQFGPRNILQPGAGNILAQLLHDSEQPLRILKIILIRDAHVIRY